ncbi:hypothetical protein R4J09_10065 [Brachyspira intermedia]|uniref:hypothetical protein n=1 Tax=Brachyspira intermedia TaxID=84377 RepID=UPI0030062E60
MKKLLITLIMLLTLLTISCSNKSTAPTNNDNNNNNNVSHSQSFTGNNFQFGTFGNVSALSINEDGSIYMNIENGLLTIKKEMVTKISDSQYTIKGQMPTIKYDASSAVTKSVMFAQSASDMNTVDVSLNLNGTSLSLSGQINSDNVNANLTEVSGYIPNDYVGIYYDANSQGYGFEIKSDGMVTKIQVQNNTVIYHEKYTEKLIKLSDNEYILNSSSLEKNIPSTIDRSTAEGLIFDEAEKYYNMYEKYTLKFENNNTLTMTRQPLTGTHKDISAIENDINEVMKNIEYLKQIDYSLFTLKLESATTSTFNKK